MMQGQGIVNKVPAAVKKARKPPGATTVERWLREDYGGPDAKIKHVVLHPGPQMPLLGASGVALTTQARNAKVAGMVRRPDPALLL